MTNKYTIEYNKRSIFMKTALRIYFKVAIRYKESQFLDVKGGEQMITLTESAAKRVQEMLAEHNEPGLRLRIGVRGGGCSGLSYGMGFDDEVLEDDLQFEQHGVQIVVDPQSAPILDGVIIDFQENEMGGGFTIDNPNAISTCGCGSSFKTADNGGTPSEC